MAAWANWRLAGAGLFFAGLAAAMRSGGAQQARMAKEAERRLLDGLRQPARTVFTPALLDGLPPPAARYLARALPAGRPLPRVARFRQHGRLRIAPDSPRWLPFEAWQVSTPWAPGFLWHARMALAGPLGLQISDAYMQGEGTGRLALQAAFQLQERGPCPEMNSAALQRYLAEAAWYPAGLLPEAGVRWQALDAHRALATLEDRGTVVALEFRFNDDGDIASVYAPARWRSTREGFVSQAWEGRFGNWQQVAGLRIPLQAEAGWYDDDAWHCVWQGGIRDIAYELFPGDQSRKEN
ncbi:DUF6544 family protein [Noviherbaspirillum aridicola]|uniref:Uncharacterized protein n=1 Tax=Noviherbaspirillum aridicola TaxID=2849687 RepID=A0ABQ4Q4J1_9BURK|nr:DUF6544 family protein [Noviherbaspirillum aridicola]GIZ51715.1 hypothetical protein NCCP691_17290 [Noviherbaspirillum aridicola]